MISLNGMLEGLLLVAAGVLGLRFTYQILNFTGSQDWIESKLGSGSTYGVYKFASLILVIAGLLAASGLGHPVANWLLSPLKGLFGQR